MKHTEAIEVPFGVLADDTADAVHRDVLDYLRYKFGDVTVARITLTAHLQTFTDAERRANRDT